MSLSIGFPNAAGITIGGKSAATVRALGDETQDAAAQALGAKEGGAQVKTGPVGLGESAGAQAETQASDNTSVAVKVLLKRLKELQQQLREQQQQLAQAQAEWRERIGKAESDISVERAKIARERTELEEKIRNYQSERPEESTENSSEKTGKPVRGRWLTRLGLKDLSEE